jgi:hypothetical protein
LEAIWRCLSGSIAANPRLEAIVELSLTIAGQGVNFIGMSEPRRTSTLRLDGVSAVLAEAMRAMRKAVETEFRQKLLAMGKSGYLDLSEEVIENLARVAGGVASDQVRSIMGSGFSQAHAEGVHSSATQEDFERDTERVPKR